MKQKILSLIALVFVILGSYSVIGTNLFNQNEDFDGSYIVGELIIGLSNEIDVKNLNVGQKDPILKNEIIEKYDSLNALLVKVKNHQEGKYIKLYEKSGSVRFSERNILLHIADYPWEPNDAKWSDQYGPKNINSPEAWSFYDNNYQNDAYIAIVDTGIDLDHPDLSGIVLDGKNCIDPYSSADDDNGHGTHCAGIARARTNNGKGIAGVCGIAPIKLIPVKVLSSSGSGSSSNVAEGIEWAANNGADVISMSLGSDGSSDLIKNACEYANGKGIILVGAAGNDGTSSKLYPAGYDCVISVAAIDSKDKKAYFSNYGSWVDIAAPGVHILSTMRGGGYKKLSGTSMACPHVAGVAALAICRELNDVKQVLFDSATDIGQSGYWKYGKVDARLGGSLGNINVDFKIEEIKKYDEIDMPLFEKPEWFYQISISLDGSDKTMTYTNYNIKSDQNIFELNEEMSGEMINVYQLKGQGEDDWDWSSENNWGGGSSIVATHSINIAESEINSQEVLVNIAVKLMDEDCLNENDIADISAEITNGDSPSGRVFRCQYDLISNKLVDDGGSKYLGSGNDEGKFPRETAGWFDGSQHPNEPPFSHEDDEWMKFSITDNYEVVKADAGGPYQGYVGHQLNFFGSAENGKSPYTFDWDLDGDGEYDDATGNNPGYTYDNQQELTIGLKATDDFGITATDTAEVVISQNNKPILSNSEWSRNNDKVTFTVHYYDQDQHSPLLTNCYLQINEDLKYRVIQVGSGSAWDSDYKVVVDNAPKAGSYKFYFEDILGESAETTGSFLKIKEKPTFVQDLFDLFPILKLFFYFT